jgi:hypothetical protein
VAKSQPRLRTEISYDQRRLFRHAGTIVEIADYAERNGSTPETTSLAASLRTDAIAIRIHTLITLFKSGRTRGSL